MNRLLSLAAAAGLMSSAAGTALGSDERKTVVVFDRGAETAEITDRITGREYVVYQFMARNGQFLTVSPRPDNRNTGFNVYIPGRGPGDEALYNSETGGGPEYYGQLYTDGTHSVSVFQNRNAARQGKVSNYDLVITLNAGRDSGAAAGPAVSQAESDCLAAVANQVGNGDVSTIYVEMGENRTKVLVRVPSAQAPWQCDWGYTDRGPGVLRVFYTSKG
jgi:hypothetical protein